MSDFDCKSAAPPMGSNQSANRRCGDRLRPARIQTRVVATVGQERSNSGAVAFSSGGGSTARNAKKLITTHRHEGA